MVKYFFFIIFKIKNIDNENLNLNLNLDYEQTFNYEFQNLQNKNDQFKKINYTLIKNMKETEKLYDKKYKDLQNTIEHNQNKLKIIQQVILLS